MSRKEYLDNIDLERAYQDWIYKRVVVYDTCDRDYMYDDNSDASGATPTWVNIVLEKFKSHTEFVRHAEIWQKAVRYRHVIEDYTNGEDVAKAVSSFVNTGSFSGSAKKFAETISRDHRSLQQSFMRLILECCRVFAKNHEEGYFDARNEQTGKAAIAMVQATKDISLPLI